nr:phenylalanine--tRNA ligase subunit alpha [Chitinophagaceae bacterium]
MKTLQEKIEAYKKEISAFTAADENEIESFRIKYLGSKGLVKSIMSEMKNVSPDNKKEAGLLLNEFKTFVEEKFASLKSATATVDTTGDGKSSSIDFSLPGDPMPVGARHPVVLMRNRIVSIFQRLGFAVAEGPEIE